MLWLCMKYVCQACVPTRVRVCLVGHVQHPLPIPHLRKLVTFSPTPTSPRDNFIDHQVSKNLWAGERERERERKVIAIFF